jgi:hypothetical protein
MTLLERGIEESHADTLIDGFVDFYSRVAEFNRLATAVGLAQHEDSHPEREALAIMMKAGEFPSETGSAGE